jgi:hypothetical protein
MYPRHCQTDGDKKRNEEYYEILERRHIWRPYNFNSTIDSTVPLQCWRLQIFWQFLPLTGPNSPGGQHNGRTSFLLDDPPQRP